MLAEDLPSPVGERREDVNLDREIIEGSFFPELTVIVIIFASINLTSPGDLSIPGLIKYAGKQAALKLNLIALPFSIFMQVGCKQIFTGKLLSTTLI